MPQNDDATRRTARERSQARMNRSGGSSSRSSTDSYGRARQDADHLSQSRYSRQTPRQTSQSSRELEGAERGSRRSSASSRSHERDGANRQGRTEGASRSSRSSRSARQADSSRGSRNAGSSRNGRGAESSRSGSRQSRRGGQSNRRDASRDSARQTSRDRKRQSDRQKTSQDGGIGQVIGNLPSFAVPAGIAVIVVIVLLALVFGVLVPSCSQSSGSSSASSSSSESASSAAATQGIVHQVAQAKAKKQAEVETANQVGSLETSNANVEALVSLLGEEEAAKLIAQAKTNPDALWIAAHPDAYAFDGIEIQYKILKLAADEPASIPYVREFPAKYPALQAVDDKDLAMDVASPSSAVPTTSIPHLYQWDRRWAYTIYSSASFGLTGCGPTSLAMVYQGLNRTVDKTPFDMAVLAESRGYMSEFNGTDSSFFTDVAPELGLNCWTAYPDATSIRDELRQGHVIIANLGPGFFTTNGHFFVLAGLTDDGQVIVNDPYSVVRSSQTWDADFIAAETMAMFVYAKA